ncbi:MAG: tyrosine--tRNA ligase [Candidatus Levybacteria bacterium]|nr:tyrosine--tRNA ligase [Candidatus Levybacteria bacterium]
MDEIEELLTRGVANIVPGKENLEKLFRSGKKLKIYNGIDPTTTKIHLGHVVPLRKLKKLAELGHEVIFLVGDFTALIGDTSDKDSERPSLTPEQVKENLKNYKTQAAKILDFDKVQIKFNSEWLNNLSFKEIIKLCQNFSANDFLSRELIRKRLDDKKRVGLHEFLYPVAQGYDHYHLDTDLQIGGTEQTFNMQAGRILMKHLRDKDSFFLTLNTLEGTDGRKMTKTWGNAIWLQDSPNDMYAKIMAIKDELIIQYYLLATDISMDEIEEVKIKIKSEKNPMSSKKDLAHKIVSELHNPDDADNAAQNFKKTVQQKEMPQEVQEIKITENVSDFYDLLFKTNLASSRAEAKRLIDQGGVSIDGKNIKNEPFFKAKEDSIIQVGKRRFIKVRYS